MAVRIDPLRIPKEKAAHLILKEGTLGAVIGLVTAPAARLWMWAIPIRGLSSGLGGFNRV